MQAKLTADAFNDIVSCLKSDGGGVGGHEKRTEGRVGLRCQIDVIICTVSPDGPKPMTVWVRDISINGIGLMTGQKLAENVELIARFSREDQRPLSILYQVKNCRKLSGDLYSVGARFARVMPDATGAVPTIGKPKQTAKPKAPAAGTAPETAAQTAA